MTLHIYPVVIKNVSPMIHCLLSRSSAEFRSAPTLIYFHGLNGSRNQMFQERYLPLAEEIKNAGFNLLSVDLRGHGERRENKETTPVDNLMKYMTHSERNPFMGAMEDIRKLVEFIVEKSIAPSGEIGVFGLSWGAMHTFYALRQEDQIRCAVALLPVCKISSLIEFRMLRNNPMIEQFEPQRILKDMSPKPLLIITAENDNRVDPQQASDLYQQLLPIYAGEDKEDQLAYTMLLNSGHTLDPRMIPLTLDWFKKYLAPDTERPRF